MASSSLITQTCLVTGGAGFIGCASSRRLADHFGRVVAFDMLHRQVHRERLRPDALDPRVELVEGDVREPQAWAKLLANLRPDVIVHLAAETGTGQSLNESTRHAATNVLGTTQMLDALFQHEIRPRTIVLASSRAVYGEGGWQDSEGRTTYPHQRTRLSVAGGQWDFPALSPTPMRAEQTVERPVSVYGATKLAQEHVLSAWGRAHDVDITLLRLQNVYGPGQSLINSYTGILTLFCRLALAGDSIPLYEDGSMRRDFVYIDDVAAAILRAATTTARLPSPIDIGSGEHQTIGDAAASIARHFGAAPPHVNGAFREGDVRHAWADVSAARRDLGWRPRVGLEEGLRLLARWVEERLGSRPATATAGT